MTPFSTLNTGCENIETALNYIGYVPFAGFIFSAKARVIYAKAQIITGAALAIFYFIKSELETNPYARQDYKARSVKSLEYCKHGALNIGRAFLEFVPFLSLITCLPYDRNNRPFLAYTDYQAPYQQPSVYYYPPAPVVYPPPYNPQYQNQPYYQSY